MFGIIAVVLLIIFIYIISFFIPNLLNEYQFNFLITSTITYILIFGFLNNYLENKTKIMDVFTNNSIFIPLCFYIVWYFIVSLMSNLISGGIEIKDYNGFFENKNTHMSKRDSQYF